MVLIDLNDQINWEKNLSKQKFFVGHTWEYCKLVSIIYKDIKPKLLILDELETKNICSVSIKSYKKYKYAYNISGYTGYNNFFNKEELKKIKKIFKKKNILTYYFSTNNFLNKSYENTDLTYYEKKNQIFLIKLNQQLEIIFKNFNSNLKRKIKKCISENISVKTTFNKREFLDLYSQNNKRLNLKENLYNKSSINFVLDKYKKKLILCAYKGKNLCSAVVVLYHDYYAEYFTSLSLDKYNYCTGYLLFEAIKILKKKNIMLFNLGGSVKGFEGIEQFKKSFGGEQITQFETKLISNLKIYNIITKNMKNKYFPKFANV